MVAERPTRTSAPPAEALTACWHAASVCDALESSGRHVAFELASDGLRIELRDVGGSVLRRLDASEVLDLVSP
jgi:hypothetical protein